jgi:regulator of replication initiation timing
MNEGRQLKLRKEPALMFDVEAIPSSAISLVEENITLKRENAELRNQLNVIESEKKRQEAMAQLRHLPWDVQQQIGTQFSQRVIQEVRTRYYNSYYS